MVKVFEARHHPEAHWVKGLLAAEGIPAHVRGEALFTTVESPLIVPGCLPSVWILEQAHLPRAAEVVDRYRRGEEPCGGEDPWSCPACGECHEPQFTDCWLCGTHRPDPDNGVA
jgi:hypothetical protein